MAKFKADGKMIFGIFIGAIIVLAFMVNISNAVVNSTTLVTTTEETITTAQANNTATLTGRANTTVITINDSGVDISSNFSVNTTDADGTLGIFLATSQNAQDDARNGTSVNVSYTFKPQGYIDESGGRSMTTLILIMSTLALLVFVVVVMWKSESLQNIMRLK